MHGKRRRNSPEWRRHRRDARTGPGTGPKQRPKHLRFSMPNHSLARGVNGEPLLVEDEVDSPLLNLPWEIAQALKEAGICFIWQLMDCNRSHLQQIPGIRRPQIWVIRWALGAKKLTLKMS
jgi:hypothetical protein